MLDRLFIAIDPPGNIRRGLAGICRSVRGARWIPEEQIHLTLRFIGEVERTVSERIDELLSGLDFAPFSLAVSGLGVFPHRGSPKVLWAGIKGNDELLRLRKKVESLLVRKAEITPDRRRFHPHLTLARLTNPARRDLADFLNLHAGLESPAFPVERISLYRSNLTPKGAIHTRLATYPR